MTPCLHATDTTEYYVLSFLSRRNHLPRKQLYNARPECLFLRRPPTGYDCLPYRGDRDEVWSGVEYQVAGHLIFEGMVEEGLTIVRGLRARYDGERRNPWNEMECGSNYARSLASWTLMLALSGFQYDLTRGFISFKPAIADLPFRCFWSTGTAWGSYEQTADKVTLRCDYGQQSIVRLGIGRANVRSIALNNSALDAQFAFNNGDSQITLERPLTLTAGEALIAR